MIRKKFHRGLREILVDEGGRAPDVFFIIVDAADHRDADHEVRALQLSEITDVVQDLLVRNSCPSAMLLVVDHLEIHEYQIHLLQRRSQLIEVEHPACFKCQAVSHVVEPVRQVSKQLRLRGCFPAGECYAASALLVEETVLTDLFYDFVGIHLAHHKDACARGTHAYAAAA